MKKLLSGSYYIVLLLGVLFVVGSFLFAKNETHFRKGEIAGHQQITPQSITQVDEMTKEYVFSGEQFTGKNICLAFYSIHLGIEVYEDGELIYDLKPVPGIFGTTPGSVWNFLEIEPGCGQVIVRTHAAYRRVGGETLSFYIGEAVDERKKAEHHDLRDAFYTALEPQSADEESALWVSESIIFTHRRREDRYSC